VVFAQPVHLARLRKYRAGGADAVARAILDKGLGGNRDQADAGLRVGAGAGDRHAAAHAVAEGDEAIDAKPVFHGQEIAVRLRLDEIRLQGGAPGCRGAKAEPVVGEDSAARCLGQLGRKLAPQGDAAERVVQQDDGRRAARCRGNHPAAREQGAAGGINGEVVDCHGLPR
jgi:hypothetical protein